VSGPLPTSAVVLPSCPQLYAMSGDLIATIK
jgi:hypothetical protein